MDYSNLQNNYMFGTRGGIAIGNTAQATGNCSIAIGKYNTCVKPVEEVVKTLCEYIEKNDTSSFQEYIEYNVLVYDNEDKTKVKDHLLPKFRNLSTDERFLDIFYSLVFPHEGRNTKAAKN